MSYSATVKGGFFPENSVNTLSDIGANGALRRRVAQNMSKHGTMGLREILRTDNGAVVGTTATKNVSRIEANAELGGKRVIETRNLVNRATVAADVTETNLDLLALSSKTTMASPVNKDGNPLGTR